MAFEKVNCLSNIHADTLAVFFVKCQSSCKTNVNEAPKNDCSSLDLGSVKLSNGDPKGVFFAIKQGNQHMLQLSLVF